MSTNTDTAHITELLATYEDVPTASGADILGSYEQIFNALKLDIRAPEANRELFVLVREAGDWKIGRYMFNKSEA